MLTCLRPQSADMYWNGCSVYQKKESCYRSHQVKRPKWELRPSSRPTNNLGALISPCKNHSRDNYERATGMYSTLPSCTKYSTPRALPYDFYSVLEYSTPTAKKRTSNVTINDLVLTTVQDLCKIIICAKKFGQYCTVNRTYCTAFRISVQSSQSGIQ